MGEGDKPTQNGETPDNPGGVLVPPPLVFLCGLVAGLALDRTVRAPALPEGLARLFGSALGGAGILLAGWFGRTMRSSGTPFRLNEPSGELLTRGPFRYSRNPGYLSFAMIYAGASLLARSSWSLLLLPAVLLIIRTRVIEKEERYLERAFGDEYLAYKARVGRWV